MYSLASIKYITFPKYFSQETQTLTPTIILIIFFWMLNALFVDFNNIIHVGPSHWTVFIPLYLSVGFPQKINPYDSTVWKYASFEGLTVMSGTAAFMAKHTELTVGTYSMYVACTLYVVIHALCTARCGNFHVPTHMDYEHSCISSIKVNIRHNSCQNIQTTKLPTVCGT
jgi:hypothetical protein